MICTCSPIAEPSRRCRIARSQRPGREPLCVSSAHAIVIDRLRDMTVNRTISLLDTRAEHGIRTGHRLGIDLVPVIVRNSVSATMNRSLSSLSMWLAVVTDIQQTRHLDHASGHECTVQDILQIFVKTGSRLLIAPIKLPDRSKSHFM
jgi:hypothetical protein